MGNITPKWKKKQDAIIRCMKEVKLCRAKGIDEEECNSAFNLAIDRYSLKIVLKMCRATCEYKDQCCEFKDQCGAALFPAMQMRCTQEKKMCQEPDSDELKIATSFFSALEALEDYPFKEGVNSIVSDMTLTDKYVWIAQKWLFGCTGDGAFFGTGSGVMKNLNSALSCIELEEDYN